MNTKKISAEIASVEYNKRWKLIDGKVDKIKMALKKHKEKFEKDSGNWGFVGDLGHTLEVLEELDQFIK